MSTVTACVLLLQRLRALRRNWAARIGDDTLWMHLSKVPTAGGETTICEWEGGCPNRALVACVEHDVALCAEHDRRMHCGVLHIHRRESWNKMRHFHVQPDECFDDDGTLTSCVCRGLMARCCSSSV